MPFGFQAQAASQRPKTRQPFEQLFRKPFAASQGPVHRGARVPGLGLHRQAQEAGHGDQQLQGPAASAEVSAAAGQTATATTAAGDKFHVSTPAT